MPEGLKQNVDFSQAGMRTVGTTSKMRKPGAKCFIKQGFNDAKRLALPR